LYDPETKHYLVEDYTITYAPSASVLRFLGGKESRVCGTSLVIGDPSSFTQLRLQGANLEATNIAAMLGTTPKLGDAATEQLVYEAARKYDLLHIAAHAGYNSEKPLLSAISMAKGGNRDGTLNVEEIQSQVDLSGVNLVVLAACQSALGKRSGGDEIIGLTRAILYAGSPGVVSTLWSISDAATTPLMELFYRHLLDGKPAADALRLAQIELLKRKDYNKPAYWAAFILTGNPTGVWKLPLKKASNDQCLTDAPVDSGSTATSTHSGAH
jgi:CHAT domain-containing protein